MKIYLNKEISMATAFKLSSAFVGLIAYIVMTLVISSIGDVELMDVDFTTMLKVTFMIFSIFLTLFLILICYLNLLSLGPPSLFQK